MHDVKIVVVDSDRAQCARISRLADQMQVAFEEFATAEDWLNAHAHDSAGVVVSEFRLLGINGIDLQQKFRQLNPRTQFVFCTSFAETWLTVVAIQNGAFTVLEKSASQQELSNAIGLAMDRYREVTRQYFADERIRRSVDQLNDRERDVLRMMLQGLLNKQIASRLDVSVRTVESCRHAIFEKTATQSLAELVRLITLAEIKFGDEQPEE